MSTVHFLNRIFYQLFQKTSQLNSVSSVCSPLYLIRDDVLEDLWTAVGSMASFGFPTTLKLYSSVLQNLPSFIIRKSERAQSQTPALGEPKCKWNLLSVWNLKKRFCWFFCKSSVCCFLLTSRCIKWIVQPPKQWKLDLILSEFLDLLEKANPASYSNYPGSSSGNPFSSSPPDGSVEPLVDTLLSTDRSSCASITFRYRRMS